MKWKLNSKIPIKGGYDKTNNRFSINQLFGHLKLRNNESFDVLKINDFLKQHRNDPSYERIPSFVLNGCNAQYSFGRSEYVLDYDCQQPPVVAQWASHDPDLDSHYFYNSEFRTAAEQGRPYLRFSNFL